jgi:hypothetical protein
MEEMEKSKKKPPQKAKATRAAKSTHLQERSEHNQHSKEGETPKRKGSHQNHVKSRQPLADSDSSDQESFNFSMLPPNSPALQTGQTPTPHCPIQKAKTCNNTIAPLSPVAHSWTTVSTPEWPQPILYPPPHSPIGLVGFRSDSSDSHRTPSDSHRTHRTPSDSHRTPSDSDGFL